MLAWRSVVQDHEVLNLDAHQRHEAADGEKGSDETVRLRLDEAWRWLLAPTQHASAEGVSDISWNVTKVVANRTSIVESVSERLRSDEHLITLWSPALLKMELDRWFWKDRNHVPVKQVWDALCAYCYLPRLRNEAVFVDSIRAGLKSSDYFGYATSVSAEGHYEGLALGATATVYVDASSVLVKPQIAKAQLDAEQSRAHTRAKPGTPTPPGKRTDDPADTPGNTTPPPAPDTQPTRFHGRVVLDTTRTGRDAGQVAEEVIVHLARLTGAKVTVALEISAEIPDGTPADVVRTVTENSRTLRFADHGFERE